MDPELYAKQVAEIAGQYAYRRRHHIPHTGHTVHRLLEAVGKLIGKKVVIDDDRRVSAAAARDAATTAPDPVVLETA